MKIVKTVFFVKSEEAFALCPNCGSLLKYHCRVNRTLKNIESIRNVYSIRILKCNNERCPTIYHRELPDIIIPLKRYDAESIEEAISQKHIKMTVAADESTIRRWRKWFEQHQIYLMMALLSVVTTIETEAEASSLVKQEINSNNPIKRIKEMVDRETKWLNETVRILVNSAKWIFNRSAFLSR